jgi:hypothetical protein
MNHFLVFLLTLAGAGPASPPAATPSALVVTQGPLRPDHALGVWSGDIVGPGGARRSLEVSFVDGLRPETLFAYFRVGDPIQPSTTLRRLGRLVNDELVFDLREGGRIDFRMIQGRLRGAVSDPAGQLTPHRTSAIELLRLSR